MRGSFHNLSADFILTLTLNNRERMLLFLPHGGAQLPRSTGIRDRISSHLEVDYSTVHSVNCFKYIYGPCIILPLVFGRYLPCSSFFTL